MKTSTVYLLHFDSPYPNGKQPRHYLGSTSKLQQRLEEHRSGDSSCLMHALHLAGIGFTLARTWDGGRRLERTLKRGKRGPRLCPICRAAKKGVASG